MLLGGILSGLYILFSFVFYESINLIFILITYIVVTGGLHLDGFADTVDSLSGGGGDREKILKIMSDSHIGAHGVAALICLLGLDFLLFKMYSLH